jgi:branched-chain amino acid transport system permease protein
MDDQSKQTAADPAVATPAPAAPRAPAPGRVARPLVDMWLPIAIVAVIVLVLPLLIPPFVASLVTKMMVFGLFGVSLNLIWGYANIPSFGHAAFFGVGGYTAAVLVVKLGISNFWLGLLVAIVMTAIVAAILGVPAFRVFGVGAGAANPIYFLLATIAFGELISRLAISLRPVTGGTTGISGIPDPNLGFGIQVNASNYYYLVFVICAVCLFVMYRVVNSHYGYGLRGIHDNEKRMQALGYNTWLYKYTSWIVAAVFGGIAGVLFAYFGSTLIPNNIGMAQSDISFLLVILGGTTVFFGPLVAAVFYVGVEYLSSIYLPARWPLVFGAMFIIAIMLIPWTKNRYQGLGPGVLWLWRKVTRGTA